MADNFHLPATAFSFTAYCYCLLPLFRLLPAATAFVMLSGVVLVSLSNQAFSQSLTNTAHIKTDAGAYIVCPLDFKNDTTGNVQNNSNIYVGGNFVNNSAFISGNISNVKLDGAAQDIGGTSSTTFNNLIIDGTDNKTISINTSVADSLVFNANKILIANNNFYLLTNATIVNADNSKFIVTNGTGNLIKKSLPFTTDFLFPVGDALNSYKPAILNYTGIIDTFAVRVETGVNPTTGADQTCVQNTWLIEESNTGGTTASLNLGWNTIDEGTSFVDSIALLWQNISGTWTSITGTPGAINNLPATNWYHVTTGITDFSAIANRFIVKTFPPPSITTQPTNQTACTGNNMTFSLTATGMGTLTYQWQENCGSGWSNLTDNTTYSGALTNNLDISNISLFNNGCLYQCIVSNAGGSVTTTTATATVNPIFNIPVNAAICQGTTYTLPDNSTVSVAGSYPVTLQTINGCDSVIVTTLTVNPIFNIPVNAAICQGTTYTLPDNSTVSVAGSYPVTLQTINGCDSVIVTNITVNSLSVAPAGITPSQNPVCSGAPVSLSVNGGSLGTGASWIWYNGNCGASQIGTGSSISVTLTSTATYYVRAEGTCDTTTCANLTITINTNLPVSVVISTPQTSICGGASVTFIAIPVNGGATPAWQWYINGVAVANATDSIFTTLTLANNAVISCILTSGETCATGNPATSNTINMQVTPTVTPTVNITSNPAFPVCYGTTVTFHVTSANGGTNPTMQWFVNNNYIVNGANYTPANISNSDQVYCVLTSTLTCVSNNNIQSNTLSVIFNPLHVLSATQQAESCHGAGDASINLNITQGTPPYTFHWDYTSDNGTATTATAANLHSGTYNVTVSDSKSCSVDTSIFISPEGTGCLFIPTVFSPNGDGENDILFVYGSSIKSLLLRIYDRWGNKIFKTDKQTVGWDGTYNGTPFNAAVFVYYLKAELQNGSITEQQGNITLLK
ncbi:MAG: gliding motility-associated C-terminal domain-containing protein [Bacteroidia bacterium]|nr:gliding motility-associated C-terminal domain-containing protein [Bacteroidia bacterium]